MTYDVTETYAYTGDEVFDSAGEFNAWYVQSNSAYKTAVNTVTGEDFDEAKFTLKKSHPVTETWSVDDQILTKTIQWPTEADYLIWENYMRSFDYTNVAFNSVTIGGMPGVSEPGLDVSKTITLP